MSFNLIDMPWIQIQDKNGNITELSIRELFHSANDITQLANELPAQDFAILRVLLAILRRAIEPKIDENTLPDELWSELWTANKLPLKEIDEYLDTWHHRFDILNPELPFMQAASTKTHCSPHTRG